MGNFLSEKSVNIEVLKEFSQKGLQLVRVSPYSSKYLLHKRRFNSWRQREIIRLNSSESIPPRSLKLIQMFSSDQIQDQALFIYQAAQITLQEQILMRSLTHSLFSEEQLLDLLQLLCGLLAHCESLKTHFGCISPQALIKSQKGQYRILPKQVLHSNTFNKVGSSIREDFRKAGLTLLTAALLRSYRCCFDQDGRLLEDVISNLKRDFEYSQYSLTLKQAIFKVLQNGCVQQIKQRIGQDTFPEHIYELKDLETPQLNRSNLIKLSPLKYLSQEKFVKVPSTGQVLTGLEKTPAPKSFDKFRLKGSQRTSIGQEQWGAREREDSDRFQRLMQQLYEKE